MIAVPTVELIAQPMIISAEMLSAMESRLEDVNGVSDPDLIYEHAGRGCYRSYHRPNPETSLNRDYLGKSIINNGHYSVLEHGSFVFHVKGISRALLAELTRHRHLSPSVESLRFCPPRDYVMHPTLRPYNYLHEAIERHWQETLQVYFMIFDTLTVDGLTKKQAREAARMVLPLSTATDLVISGNARAWREVLAKRFDPAADKEIYELAGTFLSILKDVAPAAFQDMPYPTTLAAA
ncbi:FAD-dependent thymidylate synthase [Streptosporangium sp. NPDC023825]|uniref:FAD-dependent thymidylate synthase n=1 Tax=Streptosporangium sp. NPDC023825 TaxID=3154909 RepID=UPI00343B956B